MGVETGVISLRERILEKGKEKEVKRRIRLPGKNHKKERGKKRGS